MLEATALPTVPQPLVAQGDCKLITPEATRLSVFACEINESMIAWEIAFIIKTICYNEIGQK